MKLRNKKTGEIGLVHCDATMFSNKIGVFIDNNHIDLRNPYKIYTSLAELNEEWEDYEEPKVSALYIMINTLSNFIDNELDEDKVDLDDCKQILEKLKAWQGLKDAGFEFVGWDCEFNHNEDIRIALRCPDTITGVESIKDLDLLFGGEE